MFFQFSFFLFDRAWAASLEHHFHTSGSVAAPHNQRPFYSNARPWRNPSQKELWCQFLHWQQPKQSRMRGPLHLSSFLIIWTARLSLAVSLFTVSLFLNSTNLQLLLLSLLPYPPTHTHPASPVLWASVRSHCTKMKSLTAEDVDWCKANRGKKSIPFGRKCTGHKLINWCRQSFSCKTSVIKMVSSISITQHQLFSIFTVHLFV